MDENRYFANLRETLHPHRPARRRSLSLAVEGLDQRSLLSAGVHHAIAAHAAEVMHQSPLPSAGAHHAITAHAAEVMHQSPLPSAGVSQASAAPVTLLQPTDTVEGNGFVFKTPTFYEDYVGPKLDQLNALGATGTLGTNGSFTFFGINQGALDPKVQATYVWGIDRSGNLPTGPFPGRPDIRFDATVVVKLVPGQAPSVTLNDLANKTVTTFQAPVLDLAGQSIGVNIPGFLLPSTGLALSQYRFAYWPEDGNAGSTHIASFAPAFADIQVGHA